MGERQTGATDEQLEAAARLEFESLKGELGWHHSYEHAGDWSNRMYRAARYLVPPGYVIVPVSPVRSWREALVDRQKLIEAIDGARYGGLRSGPSEPRIFGFGDADYEHAPTERIADAVLAALRATPEPEREPLVDVVHTLVEHMQGDVEYEHKLRVALAELRYAIVPLALLPPEPERPS